MRCKTRVFSDRIMITPEPGTKADPNFRLPKKQLLCIGLTVTYEKVTLTRKKNTIKIPAKLYESASSHSHSSSYNCFCRKEKPHFKRHQMLIFIYGQLMNCVICNNTILELISLLHFDTEK